jgi:2-oxoglutarate/2-oxoacid ferredoxin oxidoreductase subunit beta
MKNLEKLLIRSNDMAENFDFDKNIDISWCPGCGNFAIRKSLIGALQELNIPAENLVMVSGIGQAAKMPQYINSNFFNGLHGRGLPPASAIKACNPALTVIAEGGDGDMYGEGGNHFLHATRRNPDITLIVHNNMVYGLTKGQASPTSRIGMKTPVQVNGVFEQPLNPISLAISLDVPFVARAFSGDIDQTKEIIKQAILHKGFSLVDIFQPCISFNKINTFKWFKDNSYYLSADYKPDDKVEAFKKSLEVNPYPLGIIYINRDRKTFEENLPVYFEDQMPMFKRSINKRAINEILMNKI